MGKCIFITGTDTDVGKTVISGCIAAALRRTGNKVAYYKPVQCGGLLDGPIRSPDLALVKELSNLPDECLFNDFAFTLASSPHLASEHDGKPIDINKIKKAIKALVKEHDFVIIEGAGGLIVPLTRNYTVLNLINDLYVPVVIIARAGLGTINHSSLTVNALNSWNVPVKGIIFNFFKGGIMEEDNRSIVHSLNGVPVIGTVPFSDDIKRLSNEFEKYVDIGRIRN